MKKTIFLLVSILGLSACASFQQQKFDWRGKNFDDYVQSRGTPTSKYIASNGNTIYSFKKICEYNPRKIGETLVTVGEGNLIQNISTPTQCPTYYDTPEYKHQQEITRAKAKNEKRIKDLEAALKGVNIDISSQQTRIRSIQIDIDLAKRYNEQAKLEQAEQELKKAQEKLAKDEKYKAEWEGEIRQLKSISYK